MPNNQANHRKIYIAKSKPVARSTGRMVKNHVGTMYASPANLNINWCYGSALIFTLVVQILSGLVLATFYSPRPREAFKEVLKMANTASYGAEVRYLHRTNVSLIFIYLYRHLFRGRYYGCYNKNKKAWISGLVRFVLIRAAAFTGYVLPWGQRSLWGAIVITNLFTVIPGVGIKIVQWFWGGRAINEVTLYRFYVLHFTIPFLILIVLVYHLFAVHEKGSTDPLGVSASTRSYWVGLTPNYVSKDLRVILAGYAALFIYTVLKPDLFVHCVNYAKADNLSTPAHITPEWYLLPFYGMLRSIDSKVFGLVTRIGAFVILFRRPRRGKNTWIASARFNTLKQCILWLWAVVCGVLGGLGKEEPIDVIIKLGQFNTFLYFALICSIFILDHFEQAYDNNKVYVKRMEEQAKKDRLRARRKAHNEKIFWAKMRKQRKQQQKKSVKR